MKKVKISTIFVIFLTLSLISSSISAVYIKSNHKQTETPNNKTAEFSQEFSMPEIKDNDEFLNIRLKEANSFIKSTGEPILPIFLKTFEFPLGTRIKEINCICSKTEEIHLTKEIISASKPISWNYEKDRIDLEKNEEIYNSNQLFPKSEYSYKLSGGLNRNNKPTTFLTVQLNPIRYAPSKDSMEFVKSMKLEITYAEPKNPLVLPDEYDLLIISYDKYASLLEPLVLHKNSRGISTKLVTLSEIYDSFYFPAQGRDNPEKIKYFIKDAKENWGVTYVMLVGNFRKMPIRYTHLETDTGGTYEELEFISDLYYADLYDSEGNFSNWDSDEDGIYGEWPYPAQQAMEDAVDLSPDVYVGRLACMYGFEVKTLVKKIIDYEENAYGSDWFNKMIVVGGDTFDKNWEDGTDYNEGEEANKKALEIMEGFDAVKIWASSGNLTTVNIQNEISKGAGFLYFVGHGNPRNWGTHVNGDYKNWTEGIFNKDMLKFSNDGMYPILMVGGCHNSEFDVTPLNLLKNPKKSWIFSTWVPECWSWFVVKKSGGGAIASIGSIGYGGVNIGDRNSNDIPDCIEGADGWFETQFFRVYNEENIDFLGETYGQTITDYVNNFPVYSDRYECKIVETHVLFGDPSLKIGGYE
jgi:hypothetical protein